MSAGYSPVEGGGIQRTEMHCHVCGKQFIAELDFDITGDHVIECPHCSHEHCRRIENGKITDVRWGAKNDSKPRISAVGTWKSPIIAAQTSSVSSFIRERWLNRSDFNGR